MKKSLFLSTLLTAAALSVPAWATEYTFSGSAGSISLGNYNSDDTLIFSNVTSGNFYGSGSGSYTCAANIIINATDQSTNNNGLTLNDGASDSTYTFTGSISGSGNWTFNKSGTSQQYTFLGDMSGYSGNIDYSTERASDDHPSYFHFGNGGQAATDTNISGTGSITQHGNITYNYSSYATSGDSAITIGNSSLKAETIEFAGSVNYNVSSTTVTGYDTSATLTISNTGTTTFTGTVSGFGTVTVGSGSTLAVGTGGSLDLTGATVDLSSTIQNSGTVTIAGTSFVLDNLTSGSSGSTDYYIIVSGTGTIDYSGDASFTRNGITLNWDVYNSDGYFVVYGDHISDLTWNGTSSNNTWSTSSTDTPWSSSEGTTENSGFNNGDSVTFSSSTAEKSVIVSGAVEATSMTVSEGGYTFSSDTTNGGTIKTNSLTFKVARGDTMTIAVSEADLGAVSISRLDSGETSGDNYRVLTIGNGENATTATASSLTLLGASEISVAKDSTLTVTGNVDFNGGYSENVSGEGTLIVKGTATHATSGTLSISVANFQADTFTKTSSANTIFSGSATIGTFNAASGGGSTGNTITLSEGATLTVGTLTNAWGANFVLEADSLLNVTSANFSTGSEGYTVSGTGTFKAETFTFANVSKYTFSGITLEVGTFSVTAGNSLTFTDVNSTIGSLSISSTAPVTFTGGTTKIGSLSVGGNNGSISFSGGSVDIDSIDLEYGSITFTGEGTYNIGSYVNSPASDGWTNNSKTFAIGDNATVTVGTFSSSWHETVTFGENSVLTVTGELSLHTNDTETFSGGTINAEKLNLYNSAHAQFSNGTLNIGSGGIISDGNQGTGWTSNSVTFGDDLTVGVYGGADGTNKSWSTDATIQFTGTGNGTTFSTKEGENITLSGSLSGKAFSNEGSGSLTLSGTVSLDGAISNSGTIVVNSSTVFVLDNLTGTESSSGTTYVIITNDSGTIDGWTSLTKDNFSLSGSTITSVDVSQSGQVTVSFDVINLIWNGGSGTWDTSTANWTKDGSSVTFANGDNVTFDGTTGDGTVTVQSSGVETASVTVSGGTYSFAGGNINVVGNFTIGTGAEVDLDGSVVYADFVVNGTLKLDVTNGGGSSGEIHGTITINNGGRVELDNGDVTGYGDGDGVTQITINAGGTLYVGTTANQTLGSCDLILVGGTIDGVDGSNLDLFHSSTLIATAAEGATAENPTVSTIKGAMLTSRNDDGTTEVRVEENAVLDVQSGFWSGPNSQSSYNGNIEKTGAGTLEVTGYFAINNGSLLVDEGTVILSGTAGNSSYSFASAITVAEGASLELAFQSGDATVGSVTSSGTLKITGTTLTVTGAASIANLTLAGGSIVFSSSSANTITLSSVAVSGESKIAIGLDANNDYNDKVVISSLSGTGTLSLDGAARTTAAAIFELTGTSSQFTGTISLSESENQSDYRGITLVISSASAAAGAVIEMGSEARNNSCIALGVNAETVEIAGLTSTNSGGDVVYSGSVSLGATLGNQGATLIDYKNQSGYGTNSNYDGVSTSRNTLVINTAEGANYSFSGVIMDMLNIEKKGAGTQSITFGSSVGESAYYFDGTITVTEGTLNLDGRATNSAGITVAQGATLNIANKISLAATTDITSVTSTISGTLSIESGGQLDLAGTVTINNAITNSGTITIADGTSITVGVEVQSGDYNGSNYQYYELISGSGSGTVELGSNVTFVIDGAEITLSEIATLADGDTDWKGYISGGSLYIYAETSTTAETTNPLYWAGTEDNNTWSTSDANTPWSASDTGNAGYYFTDGADVIFGSSAAEVTTVTVVGDVVPGSITVNSAYTFAIGEEASVTTGSLTYGEGGSLTLTGAGTFVFSAEDVGTAFTISSDDSFTGNVEVVKGQLQLSGTSLGENTGVILHASTDGATEGSNIYGDATAVSIVFGGTGVALANDITIVGGGAVIIRSGSDSNSGTLSGKISSSDAAYLQLNGGGSVTLSGNVDLSSGGYVNYQGSTTFSGETVSLGKLILAQNESGTSAVTFTNSVQATVGTLTVDSSGTNGATKTLTISGGASLEVGTMTVNNAVAIAIDNGALSITTSVSQTTGTTTSVTISDGGQLSLGSNVSLNVDVMNIVLGEANYDEGNSGSGTFAIVGDTGSSLTFTDSAAITITVDSALETLLSSEGTYYFDISDGIVLTEDNLDWSTLEHYGTVSWDGNSGILSVVVGPIPEPSMFGVFFGLGALGLVATRRRRRKAA